MHSLTLGEEDEGGRGKEQSERLGPLALSYRENPNPMRFLTFITILKDCAKPSMHAVRTRLTSLSLLPAKVASQEGEKVKVHEREEARTMTRSLYCPS